MLAEADRVLDAVEAGLALARGRVIHARFLDERIADPHELALFERAAALYEALADVRAANLVGLAYVAQAQQRHDDAAALLDEAETLARSVQAHRITEQVSQARTAKNPRA